MEHRTNLDIGRLVERLDAAVLDGRVTEADEAADTLFRLHGGSDELAVMPEHFIENLKTRNIDTTKERRMKPKSFKRICYIAAAAAVVTALSITAVATGFFGVRDLVIRDDTSVSASAAEDGMSPGVWPAGDGDMGNPQVYDFGVRDLLTQDDTPVSEPAPSGDWTAENAVPSMVPVGDYDMIIPLGPPDSPEFLAAAEWRSFYTRYDEDGALLAETGDGNGYNDYTDDYPSYTVYTKELADKLEEIASKYGLSLHESKTYVNNAKELVYAAGTCDFLTGDAYHRVSGVAYGDGTFEYNGEVALQNGERIEYHFDSFVKGTFSQAYVPIGDADSYREWTYKTTSGVEVLLALSENQALLFANLENTFVTASIMAGTQGHDAFEADPVTEADLEAFADLFDFTAIRAADTPIDPPKHDLIVLQGYPDSPEFKAIEEWQIFCSHYDEDGSIIAEVGNDPNEYTERYPMYLVYSKDMADKLEEIIAKYGLTLHESLTVVDGASQLVAAAGTGDFLSGSAAGMGRVGGYVYNDGSFHYDGEVALQNGKIIDYQFGNYVKGTFSDVYLNVGDVGRYREWQYTTAGGVTVSLALGESKSLVIANLENSFVTINVLTGSAGSDFGSSAVTENDLEAFADLFDFSVIG